MLAFQSWYLPLPVIPGAGNKSACPRGAARATVAVPVVSPWVSCPPLGQNVDRPSPCQPRPCSVDRLSCGLTPLGRVCGLGRVVGGLTPQKSEAEPHTGTRRSRLGPHGAHVQAGHLPRAVSCSLRSLVSGPKCAHGPELPTCLCISGPVMETSPSSGLYQ